MFIIFSFTGVTINLIKEFKSVHSKLTAANIDEIAKISETEMFKLAPNRLKKNKEKKRLLAKYTIKKIIYLKSKTNKSTTDFS